MPKYAAHFADERILEWRKKYLRYEFHISHIKNLAGFTGHPVQHLDSKDNNTKLTCKSLMGERITAPDMKQMHPENEIDCSIIINFHVLL